MNPKVGASCDPVDSWYPYYARLRRQSRTGGGVPGQAAGLARQFPRSQAVLSVSVPSSMSRKA